METTFKKPANKGYLMTLILSVLTICANAQQTDKFVTNLTNDLAKDSGVSLMIIGGIALFGAIIFIVAKIVSKRESQNENPNRMMRHVTHNRHHHHHRMIKKSA